MRELIIRAPDDMHVHLRRGKLLSEVIGYTAKQFSRALIMPNTEPGIFTAEEVTKYRAEIQRAMTEQGITNFDPLLSIKLTDATTPATILEASLVGAVAAKLYPAGVTTNSLDGVTDVRLLLRTFGAMQECGMLLLLHGEKPGVFCLDREEQFLDTVEFLASEFPQLKIVLEHVTTKAAVDLVKRLGPNVAATITPHHMVFTLDDVVGDKLMPHNFCKPIAKRPEDQLAVLSAAMSGNPKFFLGSDSAPHTVGNKECDCGAAGVWLAPFLVGFVATVFDREGRLDLLEDFCSRFGAEQYGLPLNARKVKLVEKPYEVQQIYGSVKASRYFPQLRWTFVGKF